jgi:hypothetical protein
MRLGRVVSPDKVAGINGINLLAPQEFRASLGLDITPRSKVYIGMSQHDLVKVAKALAVADDYYFCVFFGVESPYLFPISHYLSFNPKVAQLGFFGLFNIFLPFAFVLHCVYVVRGLLHYNLQRVLHHAPHYFFATSVCVVYIILFSGEFFKPCRIIL